MNGPDMAADSVHRLGDKVRATRERHHEDGSPQQKGDEALPDIDEEVGKPPEVQYGKDVVLDMSGYHGDGKASPGSEGDGTPLTAVPGIRPTFFSSDSALPSSTGVIHDSDLTPRPSLSYESGAHADGIELTRSQSSPGPTLDRPWPESNLPHPDISISEPQSSTQTHLNTAKLSKLPHSRSSGPSGIRGGSAPPELEPPSSQIPEEYSWEWGAFPTRSPARHAFPLSDDELEARGPSHLRNSSVKSDGDFEQTFGEGGKLSPDPNNKYLIWVILGSGKLSFELSLCGDYLMGSDPKDDAKYFSEYLVDYDRLLREPRIVEHRDLVMKWDDR
ncbi:hypothetical protein FRC03_003675 [Tulasnella sp. 419]|nr:hypothetical protein FRC03_003675 [Tulasnella sp. 419]